MAVSVYRYLNYKDFIEDQVKDLGEPWGYWGKLAQAISCQPAYLSRCLKDKTNLTVDQILSLARFWSLSNSETEYLIAMLEMERAATKESKSYFLKKLEHLQQEHENLKKLVKRESLESIQDQSLYYSSWLWMALHFASSVEAYQTAAQMSQRFNVPTGQVLYILEKLSFLGLVSKDGDRWIFNSGEFHLDKKSPLIPAHHQNWRNRAIADAQNPQSDGLHYSAVYTLSEKDFVRLKEEILQWISTSNKIVADSKEEEVTCFNLDFFRV